MHWSNSHVIGWLDNCITNSRLFLLLHGFLQFSLKFEFFKFSKGWNAFTGSICRITSDMFSNIKCCFKLLFSPSWIIVIHLHIFHLIFCCCKPQSQRFRIRVERFIAMRVQWGESSTASGDKVCYSRPKSYQNIWWCCWYTYFGGHATYIKTWNLHHLFNWKTGR